MALNKLCWLLSNQRIGSTIYPAVHRHINTTMPLELKATQCLFAEPLKKKKRVDPMIIKHREERQKKKLEKQIRRLEKNARQLKPIEEVNVPFDILDNKEARKRIVEVSNEVVEHRALMKKEWARHKLQEKLADAQLVDRLVYLQQKALDELRHESEELYQAAVQVDTTLLPFTFKGPVETPPIEGYESPDGEYFDISKKWK